MLDFLCYYMQLKAIFNLYSYLNYYIGTTVSTKNLIARNALAVKDAMGWNNNTIVKKASEKGYKIHPSTVSNVFDPNVAEIKISTVDALCAAFSLAPATLLNPLGFDEQGRPVGANSTYPEHALNYAINAVLNLSEQLDIDNREWINNAIKETVKAHLLEGESAAERALLKSLYNNNNETKS
ncbi:hypothetical protein [Pseudoalteromonas ulvae]|nr:hypothetical protein [Pseudoalteromonas ulvae]